MSRQLPIAPGSGAATSSAANEGDREGSEAAGQRVTSTIDSFDHADISHTYADPGSFPDGVIVTITGSMEGFNIVNASRSSFSDVIPVEIIISFFFLLFFLKV